MLDIKPLSQRDSEWKDELLGFNTNPKYSIGNYGCLITSLAMTANWYGRRTNPSKINQKLKDVSGFANGGFYIWGSITKIYPEIIGKRRITREPLTDYQMGEIKNWLDSGHPVMLHLDMYPETAPVNMHWVLAVGYNKDDEDDIKIADPWTGNIRSLQDYLGTFAKNARQAVEGYVGYISEPPEDWENGDSEPSEVSLLKEQIERLETDLEGCRGDYQIIKKRLYEKEQEHEKLEDKYIDETKSLKEQIENAQREYAGFRKKVLEQYEIYEQRIEDWETKYNKLKEEKEVDEDMDKKAIWEAVKEPLRLLAMAIVSLLITHFSGLPYEWAGALTVLLRFIDKLLHEIGKARENESLIKGLTRF